MWPLFKFVTLLLRCIPAFFRNQAVTGELNAEQLDHRLDAMRWLVRSANHLWRMGHHIERMADSVNVAEKQAPASPSEEDDVDDSHTEPGVSGRLHVMAV